MTITRKLAPLTAVALSAVVLLAGCTSTPDSNAGPTKTPSSSASATPTPTSTPYEPVSEPGKVSPPKSSDDAYVAANRTVKDFVAVQYEIQADTGAKPERIEPFAIGSALENVKTVAAGLAEKKITTKGAPVWTADASTTTFGVLTPSQGTPIDNGIVYLKGCYDVSKQSATYDDGSAAPVSAQRVTPVQFNVRYVPQDKSWKVDALQSINGQQGAPAC